jgi:hypothetical protein
VELLASKAQTIDRGAAQGHQMDNSQVYVILGKDLVTPWTEPNSSLHQPLADCVTNSHRSSLMLWELLPWQVSFLLINTQLTFGHSDALWPRD